MYKRARTQPLMVSISDYEHPAIAALEDKELKYAVFPDSAQRILAFLGGEHRSIQVGYIRDRNDGLIVSYSTSGFETLRMGLGVCDDPPHGFLRP